MKAKWMTFTFSFIAFSYLMGYAITSQSVPKQRSVNDSEHVEDKTLSPYFFVRGGDPDIDRLPLKSTRVDADITGVIAQVKVTQVYRNTGKKTLEAVYIFPASTRAAVYAMRMTIGERVIEAKIEERQQARQDYEDAIKGGKTASLLEQQRPNVFQMNVANILPGDEIKVELCYTELLVPVDNVYEFVYPTVVGPRYSNREREGAADTERWVENPYLHEGEDATYTFGLDMTVTSGIPISRLTIPSHGAGIEYADERVVHISLPESETHGNRDFVLRYSLAGDQIESGLILSNGLEEKFFLLMLEPPERVEPDEIVPREYIFIIDVSGSMSGYPLDISKRLMEDLLQNLRRGDHFNVLLFAGSNMVMSERSLPATPGNIRNAVDLVTRQSGGGGTELVPALRRALALPEMEGASRIIVIATDGYVDVEKEAFELIRANLNEANLFAFGIGSSVNRHLIEGMARAGMGEPFVVLKPEEAEAMAGKFRDYISSPVLTGIDVNFSGFDAYDVEPLTVPDLFARRPIILFGKYRGEPRGEITITGSRPGQKLVRVLSAKDGATSEDNEALRYLWARHRLSRLSDSNLLSRDDGRIEEITNLGLTYNLLTEFTSFVAIDQVVRADGETHVTVKQPLPLPQGVSDLAVGDRFGAQYSISLSPGSPSEAMSRKFADPGLAYDARHSAQESRPGLSITIKKDTIVVDGSIPKKDLVRIIEERLPEVIACLEADSTGSHPLRGEYTVEWVIHPDWSAIEARVVGGTAKDKAFESCLSRIFEGLPRRRSEGITRVEVTLTIK